MPLWMVFVFPLKKKRKNTTTLRCLWTSLWLLTNQFSREGDEFLLVAPGSGLLPVVEQRLD